MGGFWQRGGAGSRLAAATQQQAAEGGEGGVEQDAGQREQHQGGKHARDLQPVAGLQNAIRKAGANPAEWRAVAGAVPISAILSIEVSATCQPFQWVALETTAESAAA